MSLFTAFCLALIAFGIFAMLVELRDWWRDSNQDTRGDVQG